VDVYYVGGFGVMGWVSAPEYSSAQPDPLVDTATGIMQHMNTHHAPALIQMARAFAGIESEEVTMTSVDRLGFHIRFKTPDGTRGARIAFLREVKNQEETRNVVVDMVTEARKK
jgi:putative heme iron utilization protein